MNSWSPWSEVERIAQPLECLFLFLQIAVTQPLEASVGAELLQKGIHLHAQGIISLAHADCPGLLLERDQQRPGCCRVALPVLVDRHLVIDKGICLALYHLEDR